MHEPKVSVIIPCFNVQNYLPITINALLKQKFQNFEVWLIDDGSVDGTQEICKAICLRDERFSLVSLHHSGPAVARNYILDNNLARGDYVWFLDADDIPNEDFLLYMVKRASLFNCDIVYCNFTVFDNGSIITNACSSDCDTITKEEFIANVFSLRTKVGVNGGFLWNKLIKRSCIRALRIPDFPVSEDEVFLYFLTQNIESISFVNKSLYQYQRRSGQLTASANFMDYFIESRYLLYTQSNCNLIKAAYLQAMLIFMVSILRANHFNTEKVSYLKDLIRNFMFVEDCKALECYIDLKFIKLLKLLKIFPKMPNIALRTINLLPIVKIYRYFVSRGQRIFINH